MHKSYREKHISTANKEGISTQCESEERVETRSESKCNAKNSVIKLIASSVRKLFLYLLKTVHVGIAQCIMLFLIRNNGKYCIDFCHFLQVYCLRENVNQRYYLNLRGNKRLNVKSHHHNDRSNVSFVKSKQDFDETVGLML